MATYDSNRFLERRPMRGPGIGGGNVRSGYARVAVPAGATSADTIRFLGLPALSQILDFHVKATTAITMNIGDAAVPARFASAQAVAANALPARVNVPAAFGFTYPQVGNGIGNKNIVTGAPTVTVVADTVVEVFIVFTVQEP